MNTRYIVLHYHLFKNAGTSLDQMLQAYFKAAWVTAEFPMAGDNNTDAVGAWITAQPEAQAFSSHTMVGPLPHIDGAEIIPLILLRDPLARLVSAYHFERQQQADTWGAQLAKTHDFEGYVRARLEHPNDRQCRNFQVSRLASFCPGDASELDRAKAGLDLLHEQGIIGRVEAFQDFTTALQARLAPVFPRFEATPKHSNTTQKTKPPIPEKLTALLQSENADDIALVAHANALLGLVL